jgi:hypothetical protein
MMDLSTGPPHRGRIKPLDALIVPAGRKAERLRPVAELAASANILLVVLASRNCHIDEASGVVASIPGCRSLIAGIPDGYRNEILRFRTSHPSFTELTARQNSDLSLKRNLGLLLARLMRWDKIMFLDDDIYGITNGDLIKVAAQLETHQVTGLISRSYPDNSVVCHAKRVIGQWQDNFVTGAALGVNTGDMPLDFFPEIYNEDWFFFARQAEQGEIVSVGNAYQRPYKPFADPNRAVTEEFGDLVAEGLYALFDDGRSLNAATSAYWKEFISDRANLIEDIADRVFRISTHEAIQAYDSMQSAGKQLAKIHADDCERFVATWREDRGVFARTAYDMPPLMNHAAACEFLQLPGWREAEFAIPDSRRSRLVDLSWTARGQDVSPRPVGLP